MVPLFNFKFRDTDMIYCKKQARCVFKIAEPRWRVSIWSYLISFCTKKNAHLKKSLQKYGKLAAFHHIFGEKRCPSLVHGHSQAKCYDLRVLMSNMAYFTYILAGHTVQLSYVTLFYNHFWIFK